MTIRMQNAAMIAAMAGVAALAAACEGRPNGGLTQIRTDALPYPVARQQCWERAIGAASGAQGSSAARDRLYDLCMEQAGWAYRRAAS